METKFELGQQVCISRRFTNDHATPFQLSEWKPWKEGTVTAVGTNTVRVRTVTRWPIGKVRWIHLDHPLWQVTPVIA